MFPLTLFSAYPLRLTHFNKPDFDHVRLNIREKTCSIFLLSFIFCQTRGGHLAGLHSFSHCFHCWPGGQLSPKPDAKMTDYSALVCRLTACKQSCFYRITLQLQLICSHYQTKHHLSAIRRRNFTWHIIGLSML